jgi:hypothetical protein
MSPPLTLALPPGAMQPRKSKWTRTKSTRVTGSQWDSNVCAAQPMKDFHKEEELGWLKMQKKKK